MKPLVKLTLALGSFFSTTVLYAASLPGNFVYLSAVDPSIQQDMRYATYHNFVGAPITGYEKGTCILTKPTAEALKEIQQNLRSKGYSLKVYDCYRPAMAVDDFERWSFNPSTIMKAEFYPRTNKKYLFSMGYIAARSGHTRGSTIDLTLVPLNTKNNAQYTLSQPLVACYAPVTKRFPDNSIDMGTGYDCLDSTAYINTKSISKTAMKNRMILRTVMTKQGFVPYDKEWWHFTLKNEPYPYQYFNFKVV